MIIYGTKAVHLKSEQSVTAICPSCETQGTTIFSVFRKHAHIFWVPLFPIGKVSQSTCEHCKATLEEKEMPATFKRELDVVKSTSKGPIWQFSGIAIIAVLIVWGNFANDLDKEEELTFIAAPLLGDIYEYKMTSNSYSTWKVVGVSSDSVEISENQYEINKLSKIYKIDKPENYSLYPFKIAKTTLQFMYDSGDIKDINRD